MKKLSLSLLSAALALTITSAFATPMTPITNIVTNGGFETGDFTGWTQGGNTDFTGVDVFSANSGSFGAFMGPGGKGGPGSLSQNLTTVVGASYELSFFMYGESSGESLSPLGFGTIQFQVFWNGVMIFDTTNPPISYQQFSFANLTATGTSTQLQFVFQNDPSFFHLDDVVAGITATGVPEAMSTLWLALPTLAMIAFLQLRRKLA